MASTTADRLVGIPRWRPEEVSESSNRSVSQMFALPGAGYSALVTGSPARPAADGSISQYHESPVAGGGVYRASAAVGEISKATTVARTAYCFTLLPSLNGPLWMARAGSPVDQAGRPPRPSRSRPHLVTRTTPSDRVRPGLAGAVARDENQSGAQVEWSIADPRRDRDAIAAGARNASGFWVPWKIANTSSKGSPSLDSVHVAPESPERYTPSGSDPSRCDQQQLSDRAAAGGRGSGDAGTRCLRPRTAAAPPRLTRGLNATLSRQTFREASHRVQGSAIQPRRSGREGGL